MAIMRSATEKEDLRRWVKFSKEKAQRLLAHAEDLSRSVFSSSDHFISFLDLTSRIHHYDAYNLLLIWEKCPSASCLAGYKVWERQLPPGSQVLRKEHIGKGIDLIAPFTDGSHEQSRLVWYSVSVFDISQTMLPSIPSSNNSPYFQDENHEYFIVDALKQILGTKFQRSVVIQPPTRLMQETGLPGQLTEKTILIRDDLPHLELLQWLTETVVQLSIEEKNLSAPASQLMRNCVQHCLFRIWGLEDFTRPPSCAQLESVAFKEMSFLHLLRDTLRELDSLSCSLYLSSRQQDDDLNDFELDELLYLPKIQH